MTTRSGDQLALRLARPGWRRRTDLEAEAIWLDALAHDTDLLVPRIIRARSGEAVIDFGTTKPHYATLMTWLPGTLLGKSLTEPNLVKMGYLFARLHLHAAAWTPPADFPAGRFTGWLSRDEDNLLFSDEVAGDVTPAARAVIAGVRNRVDAAYAALDPADLRVIHCDLWHANIKIHRGQLAAFDFEDTIIGFRLHDIAMALLDLLETVGNARYAGLLIAFRRGYEALLPWPDGDLNALQMGRFLWKLNWVARFDRQHLPGFTTHAAGLFEHALAHGEMPFAGEA